MGLRVEWGIRELRTVARVLTKRQGGVRRASRGYAARKNKHREWGVGKNKEMGVE